MLSCYPLGYHGDGAAASAPDPATAPATLLCAGGFGPDGEGPAHPALQHPVVTATVMALLYGVSYGMPYFSRRT